jgi:hypothetical protein
VIEIDAEIAVIRLEHIVVGVVGVGQRQDVVTLVGEQHRAVVLHRALALDTLLDQRIGIFAFVTAVFLGRVGSEVHR